MNPEEIKAEATKLHNEFRACMMNVYKAENARLQAEVERLTEAVMHSPTAQLRLKELEGKTTFEEINAKEGHAIHREALLRPKEPTRYNGYGKSSHGITWVETKACESGHYVEHQAYAALQAYANYLEGKNMDLRQAAAKEGKTK